MEPAALIEKLIKSLPYPGRIHKLQIEDGGGAVRFNWRGTRCRISGNGFIEEIDKGALVRSDKAVLMEHLLKVAR